MKGYRFSLQSVLRVRHFEKMREAQKLAEASRFTMEARRVHDALQRELAEGDHGASEAGSALGALHRRQALVALQQRTGHARLRVDEAHAAEEGAREAVKESWRREKALEKLRAREHARFLSEQEAEDRLAADDFINALNHRGKVEERG